MLGDLFTLEGQTALVAGGTGSIGRALSHALLAQGAAVAVLGRSAEKSSRVGARGRLHDRHELLPRLDLPVPAILFRV